MADELSRVERDPLVPVVKLKDMTQAVRTLQNNTGNLSAATAKADILEIETKLFDTYKKYKTKSQRLYLGDHLANIGAAEVFTSNIEWLRGMEDGGFSEDVWPFLRFLYRCCLKYSTLNKNFSEKLGKAGIIPILVQDLQKVKETGQKYRIVNRSLGILYNISRMSPSTRPLFRETNAIESLIPYLNEKFRTKVTLTLAYVIDEKNLSIVANPSVICFIIGLFTKAVDDETKRCAVEGTSYSATELAMGIERLAVNDTPHDDNKLTLVREGVLPPLFKLMTEGDEEEQLHAIRAISQLAFHPRNREKIRPFIPQLQAFKQSKNNRAIAKAACGALWELQDAETRKQKDGGKTDESKKSSRVGHVMLSYHREHMEVVKQINNALEAKDYMVWMDVDQMGARGSTLESLAEAVESAAVVLICMSRRYKESANCRREAEYTATLNKRIIPLMMESGYQADGWLGNLVAGRKYFDFAAKGKGFDSVVASLIEKIDRVTGRVSPQTYWTQENGRAWMQLEGQWVQEKQHLQEEYVRVNIEREKSVENELNQFVKNNKAKGLLGSFGEIEFVGFGGYMQRSPYIRVKADVDPGVLWELMTKYWKLERPKLVISVTGGGKALFLDERFEIFEKGLVKASQSTGAWIITGGLNEGVMKYVGEAISISVNTLDGKMHAVGIVKWGNINNRKSLEGPCSYPAKYRMKDLKPAAGTNMSTLDPNHTHFILVGDGTTEEKFPDITVRTRLEKYAMKQLMGDEVMKDLTIPVVLLVVEGGKATLRNTMEAVEKNIPAVIIDGSGRVADLIAFSKRTQEMDDMKVRDKLMATFKLVYEVNRRLPPEAKNMLKQLICILKDPTLVTVLSLQEVDTEDITNALFKALINAKKGDPESQLQLALAFNQSDLARKDIFNMGNREEWKKIDMESHMEMALKLDKVEFVRLLLDHGVHLKKFLTVERLRGLYSYTGNACAKLVSKLVEKERSGWWSRCCWGSRCCPGSEPEDLLGLVDKVICTKLLSGQISSLYSKSLESGDGDQSIKKNPMQHLLLWAVMMNRRELALVFWRRGTDHIASALTASKILTSLAKESENELDLSQDLHKHANELKKRAIGVIDECYRLNKETSPDLLIRRQENWGNTTSMDIASSIGHIELMSHTVCQSKLNRVWKGKMALNTSWLKMIICTFLPFMVFIVTFDAEKGNLQENQPQVVNHSRLHSVKEFIKNSKIYKFQVAPVTKFMYTAAFYVVFLVIFSIFILTDLHPREEKPISSLEWLTIAWLASLLIEELRQISSEHPTARYKFKSWIKNTWNKMDFGLLLTFLVSFLLHLAVPAGPGFEVVRVAYCITLWIAFVRLLQLFMVQKNIGPKVIMIFKMVVDLMFFLLILLVFVLAYAVIRHTLVFPNSPVEWALLGNVLRIPYWQVYGELFVDQRDGTLPDGYWLVYLLQGAYMLLTNVLLLNLLIAMFSFTFKKVQDNSEQIWRFYRYNLIYQFVDRPWGAPPVILLSHVWMLLRWLVRKCESIPRDDSNDLKREFLPGDIERQQALEKAGAENYLLRSGKLQNMHIDTKIPTTSTSHQVVQNARDDLGLQKSDSIKRMLREVLTNLEYE